MKVTKDGQIQFEPVEWVDAMSPNARLHLLHYLAADGKIIEAAIGSLMLEQNKKLAEALSGLLEFIDRMDGGSPSSVVYARRVLTEAGHVEE